MLGGYRGAEHIPLVDEIARRLGVRPAREHT
jgi:hypothetical protein